MLLDPSALGTVVTGCTLLDPSALGTGTWSTTVKLQYNDNESTVHFPCWVKLKTGVRVWAWGCCKASNRTVTAWGCTTDSGEVGDDVRFKIAEVAQFQSAASPPHKHAQFLADALNQYKHGSDRYTPKREETTKTQAKLFYIHSQAQKERCEKR
eukprot:TRINITY_DN67768_c10_g5_i1.p2 TRINITY_DN67768_c10_g5~~TRINITY_DN67768_c10_g5_i1.p2  ORF type:complete len:154 (-),score=25.18 TRINITY_DN67768_c10_g5_i1:1053-1514(-)